MRSDTEINNEIVALRNALAKGERWNAQARELIEETINVLKKRMTPDKIEAAYYVDETSDEYNEGDNDLYHALMLVGYWMEGQPHYKAPSTGL